MFTDEIREFLAAYADYTLFPMIAIIVGLATAFLAILLLIFAIFYRKGKAKALYATSGVISPVCLALSTIVTVVFLFFVVVIQFGAGIVNEYIAALGSGTVTHELETFGFFRDFFYGVLFAPCILGMPLDGDTVSTLLSVAFYALTMFLPALLGFVAFGITCHTRKKYRTARSAAAVPVAVNPASSVNNVMPATATPVPVIAQPVNAQPVNQPIPQPADVKTVNEQPVNTQPVDKLINSQPAVPVAAVAVATEEKSEQPIDTAPMERLAAPALCSECGTKITGAFCSNCGTPAIKKAEPAESAPAGVAPVEEAPAEEAPAEVAPVEEAPAEEAPAEVAPAEETPAEEAPAEETPVEETPVEETPAELAPVKETPAEAVPIEEAPAVNNTAPAFCGKCGAPLNGMAFCSSCGTPSMPSVLFCKGCGTKLPDGALFCTQCGTRQ